ncbi:MAG: hypothetical protein AAF658_05520 [Myxococcota bacterium]
MSGSAALAYVFLVASGCASRRIYNLRVSPGVTSNYRDTSYRPPVDVTGSAARVRLLDSERFSNDPQAEDFLRIGTLSLTALDQYCVDDRCTDYDSSFSPESVRQEAKRRGAELVVIEKLAPLRDSAPEYKDCSDPMWMDIGVRISGRCEDSRSKATAVHRRLDAHFYVHAPGAGRAQRAFDFYRALSSLYDGSAEERSSSRKADVDALMSLDPTLATAQLGSAEIEALGLPAETHISLLTYLVKRRSEESAAHLVNHPEYDPRRLDGDETKRLAVELRRSYSQALSPVYSEPSPRAAKLVLEIAHTLVQRGFDPDIFSTCFTVITSRKHEYVLNTALFSPSIRTFSSVYPVQKKLTTLILERGYRPSRELIELVRKWVKGDVSPRHKRDLESLLAHSDEAKACVSIGVFKDP